MSSNKRGVDTSGGEETVFHLDPDLHGQVYCYKVPFLICLSQIVPAYQKSLYELESSVWRPAMMVDCIAIVDGPKWTICGWTKAA